MSIQLQSTPRLVVWRAKQQTLFAFRQHTPQNIHPTRTSIQPTDQSQTQTQQRDVPEQTASSLHHWTTMAPPVTVLNVAEKPSVARALAGVFSSMPGSSDRPMQRDAAQIFHCDNVRFPNVYAQGQGQPIQGPSTSTAHSLCVCVGVSLSLCCCSDLSFTVAEWILLPHVHPFVDPMYHPNRLIPLSLSLSVCVCVCVCLWLYKSSPTPHNGHNVGTRPSGQSRFRSSIRLVQLCPACIVQCTDRNNVQG